MFVQDGLRVFIAQSRGEEAERGGRLLRDDYGYFTVISFFFLHRGTHTEHKEVS